MDQRVPDTRPEAEIFLNIQSVTDKFSKSSGILGTGYQGKPGFCLGPMCACLNIGHSLIIVVLILTLSIFTTL